MMPPTKNPATDNIKRRRPERTPDQIARKRDQDREAQRLSRERTRRRIEEAESRLSESEAVTARYERELKRTADERDAARVEIADLKHQLDTACSQLDAARAHLASVAHLLGVGGSKASSPSAAPLDAQKINTFLSNQALQLQSPQASEILLPRRPSNHLDLLSIQDVPRQSASPASSAAFEHRQLPRSTRHASSQADSQGSPYFGTAASAAYDSPSSVNSWVDFSALLPKNSAPSCPMDSILTIFCNSRRALLQNGEAEEKVFGPKKPALCVLPALGMRSDVGNQHPVSQMLAEVMSTIQVLNQIPEQIACLWYTNLSLRFCILPTKENWDAQPDWMHPVQSQLSHTHPFWMDHVPWPHMRAALAERPDDFPQEEFGIPYFEGLSVNWPYDPLDAVARDESTGSLVVSPAFEAHLRNLDNWSLSPQFDRAHPTLAGTYRLGR